MFHPINYAENSLKFGKYFYKSHLFMNTVLDKSKSVNCAVRKSRNSSLIPEGHKQLPMLKLKSVQKYIY